MTDTGNFQEQHPAAEEKTRKRPLRFIEEKGLECALWPHLYWDSNLCETVVRATDERRQAARRTGLSDDSDKSSAEGSDDGEEGIELKKGRHSIRRSFMKKVLGPHHRLQRRLPAPALCLRPQHVVLVGWLQKCHRRPNPLAPRSEGSSFLPRVLASSSPCID